MKLLWLTDIHLNFLEKEKRILFYERMQSEGEAIVITGDIAEADSVVGILQEMAAHLKKAIYFVLGNHDYYRGNIEAVRQAMLTLSANHPHLLWLGANSIQLNNETYLVGQDGWADGRYGDYHHSPVVLNDSRLIVDLFQQYILGRTALLEKMQQLADSDARRLYEDLNQSLNTSPKKIIVLTHVPPFKETARHEGRISSDEFLPFFSSKATGDVLLRFANTHPKIEMLVLCGHTHDSYQYTALPNLTVCVGKAEYYQPDRQAIIDTQNLASFLSIF